MPAILQRGEEVITKNDPRHRDNGGLLPPPAPSGGGGSVKVEFALDAESAEPAAERPARKSRSELFQEKVEHPLVQRTVERFNARPVRVDPPSEP